MARPASYQNDTEKFILRWGGGANWLGREANNSLLSSAEVKNDGLIPPLFHASSWCDA
jgi:hypothetical protein